MLTFEGSILTAIPEFGKDTFQFPQNITPNKTATTVALNLTRKYGTFTCPLLY